MHARSFETLALTTLLLAVACSGASDQQSPKASASGAAPAGVVLYTIGVSTDHYGTSSPRGFGVVVDLGTPAAKHREVRSVDLHGAEWIGGDQILVPRSAPPFRPPLLFRLQGRALIRTGPSPLPALDTQQEWSPDGRLVASKQIEPCEPNQRPRWRCYRQADEIYLQAADGSGRRVVAEGSLDSWTPDGRLLVVVGPRGAFYHYRALNVRTGRRALPLSPERVATAAGLKRAALGPPRWSADGRYIAAMVAGKWPKSANVFHALVIARANGTPVRVVTSPYVISMFAWSLRGHRLAWTTSGFPTPHELFVLDDPSGQPRRLFVADRHFDWITWSPDGRRVLLDDENAGRWLLITTVGQRSVERYPRLGGRPYWCCPVNAYSRFND